MTPLPADPTSASLSGSTTLAPDLTADDVRVLRALPPNRHNGARHRALGPALESTNVRHHWLTLSGLRFLGYVNQSNGWWKRTALGDAYLHNLDAPPAQQETLA